MNSAASATIPDRWHIADKAAVPLLYIAGSGRCGSTLLDRMLGHTEGVFAAGEIRLVWPWALLRGGRCGCGAPFRSCDVWSAIFSDAFGGFGGAEPQRMWALQGHSRARNWPKTRTGPTWRRFLREMDEYITRLGILYRSIERVTGADLIVDASKDSMYASILCATGAVSLSMAHLVRDPRACAFSWQRKKDDPGQNGSPMLRWGAIRSSGLWLLINEDSRTFGLSHPDRYRRFRYEDFVGDPIGHLRQLGGLVGIQFDESIFIEKDTVCLGSTHSVWGNANRYETGSITLRLDDAWRKEMPLMPRTLATLVTAPRLRRYGYEVFFRNHV